MDNLLPPVREQRPTYYRAIYLIYVIVVLSLTTPAIVFIVLTRCPQEISQRYKQGRCQAFTYSSGTTLTNAGGALRVITSFDVTGNIDQNTIETSYRTQQVEYVEAFQENIWHETSLLTDTNYNAVQIGDQGIVRIYGISSQVLGNLSRSLHTSTYYQCIDDNSLDYTLISRRITIESNGKILRRSLSNQEMPPSLSPLASFTYTEHYFSTDIANPPLTFSITFAANGTVISFSPSPSDLDALGAPQAPNLLDPACNLDAFLLLVPVYRVPPSVLEFVSDPDHGQQSAYDILSQNTDQQTYLCTLCFSSQHILIIGSSILATIGTIFAAITIIFRGFVLVYIKRSPGGKEQEDSAGRPSRRRTRK